MNQRQFLTCFIGTVGTMAFTTYAVTFDMNDMETEITLEKLKITTPLDLVLPFMVLCAGTIGCIIRSDAGPSAK